MNYRPNKRNIGERNNYIKEIRTWNYNELLSELNKVNNRLLLDKVKQLRQASGKYDRIKGNTYELDKWKKVQLMNSIQKKYKK